VSDGVADPPWDQRKLTRVGIPHACRAFVEELIGNALRQAELDGSGGVTPDVDWASIWRAGDDAPCWESALGSIVTEAFVRAKDIARSADEVFWRSQSDRWTDVAGALSQPVAQELRESTSAPHVYPEWDAPRVDLGTLPLAVAWNDQPQPNERLPVETEWRRSVPKHSGWSTCFTWTRNIGVVMLLFVVWQLWGTAISQHHEQHQLQNTFAASVKKHHHPAAPSVSGPALVPASEVVPLPPEGSVIAKLQIPALQLDEIVVSGTAEADLAKGPGHYVGTAVPGQAGNVAIAGHRTTNGAPFNRLGQLAVGDQIYLTTTSGERLTYLVSQAPHPVSPSDVTVLDDFGDNRITLTTCNPEFSAAQRLIVVGELQQPKPPPVSKSKPRAYHIVDVQTASWNWSLLPVVVLEAGLLFILGLSNRRFSRWYGSAARWLILVPLWTVGLYLLFNTLTTFLPSTI
jgi:sortase A